MKMIIMLSPFNLWEGRGESSAQRFSPGELRKKIRQWVPANDPSIMADPEETNLAKSRKEGLKIPLRSGSSAIIAIGAFLIAVFSLNRKVLGIVMMREGPGEERVCLGREGVRIWVPGVQ
jgi:hypothetical protein